MSHIVKIVEFVKTYCAENRVHGFIAANSTFCLKCADYEAAQKSGLPHVLFVDQAGNVTLY